MPDAVERLETTVKELVVARARINASVGDLGKAHARLLGVLDHWIHLAANVLEASKHVDLPKAVPPAHALRLIRGGKPHGPGKPG